MSKKFKLSIIILSLSFFICNYAFAGNLTDALNVANDVAGDAGYKTDEGTNVSTVVGSVIKAFLTLLGTIFVVLMVYGGYLWMTAMGSSDKTEKAKSLFSAAIIGLIITLGAYAISYFVLEKFTQPTLSDEMSEVE